MNTENLSKTKIFGQIIRCLRWRSLVILTVFGFIAVNTTAALNSTNNQAAASDNKPLQTERQTTIRQMKTAFNEPPSEFTPHTWWHWMSGEISKSGITKDLEGMKAAGIGGATIFEIGGGAGRGHIFDTGKNKLFSDEWKTLVRHALSEAHRLGLELGFHYSPGWSGSGGPWVSVQDSMKKLVFNAKEMTIAEQSNTQKPIAITLKKPNHYQNYYQDLALYAVRGHDIKTIKQPWVSGSGFGEQFVANFDNIAKKATLLSQENIIDITKYQQGEQLNWQGAEGKWTLIRVGFTSTGKKNRVARKNFGSGLEADKFDVNAITRAFYAGVPGKMLELEQQLAKQGIDATFKSITMDSWEVGYQNWSETFVSEFKKRRGYDISPYLLVLTGMLVDSAELTQRILWDCRKTYSELASETFGGTIRKLANKHGKKILIQPYRQGPFHSFDYGMQADIVMSEFWKGGNNIERVKSVSSIAHVRNDKEHRAEAFTTNYFNGGWRDHPWQYKMVGDQAFSYGLNSITFHSSAHQPLPDNIKPGMSMGRWGAMVNRKQTWWPMAPAYMNYLARSQYLLRSGRFIGDVLFVTHEHMPLPLLKIYPDLSKAGYDYDIISPTFFMKNAQVKDGKLTLPGGMNYELIVFPQTDSITVQLMNKIKQMVNQGVPTIGYNYTNSPSFEDMHKNTEQAKNNSRDNNPYNNNSQSTQAQSPSAYVAQISRQLINDAKAGKLNNYFLDIKPLEVLTKLGIDADFRADIIPSDATIRFIHHNLDGKDIYFVANSAPKRVRGKFTFKVGRGQPSLWDAVTGEIRDVTLFSQQQGFTTIQLELDRWQSLFVVFDPTQQAKPRFATLTDNKPIQESQRPTLKIISGKRGKIFSPTPDKNMDITQALRDLQQGNQLVLEQPPGQGKSTNIRYTINGEDMFHFGRVAEKKVNLVGGDAQANALTARVVHNENHQTQLEVNQPGTYTLTNINGKDTQINVPKYQNQVALTRHWTVGFEPNLGMKQSSIKLDSLTNLSKHANFSVRHYSGILTYLTTFELSEAFLIDNKGIDLSFSKIANIAEIEVNNINLGYLWARPYKVNVADALKVGKNTIRVKVANSWSNRLIGDEYFKTEVTQDAEGALAEAIPDWAWRGDIENRPEPNRVAFTTNRFYTKDDPLPPSGLIGEVKLEKWIAINVDRADRASQSTKQ